MAEALSYYQQDLEICRKLAAADPRDAQAQRDLWIAYWRMAKVAEAAGSSQEAEGFWLRAWETLSGMVTAGIFVSADDLAFLKQLEEKTGRRSLG